jgi:hypothetical protein
MTRLSDHDVPEVDARFKAKRLTQDQKRVLIERAVGDILRARTYEAAARLVLTGLAEGARKAGAFG